jgi:hypothetical protein
MRAIPGQPRGTTRLRRVLGLDRNPLYRASDGAEAWIRIVVLAAFLAGGPLAVIGGGHWAHHAEPGKVAWLAPVAAVTTLVLVALALLAILRLIQWLFIRRHLAAWDAAWSTVGPQWTRRRP